MEALHRRSHLDYSTELHDRDDDYSLAPDTMIIDAEITGEKQQQHCAKSFEAARPLYFIKINFIVNEFNKFEL